jgi:hypothetical protein
MDTMAQREEEEMFKNVRPARPHKARTQLLNISTIWPFHQHMRDRDPPEENEGVFKKARPLLRSLEGKAAATWTGGAYGGVHEQVKWRPACALARRSASARRREAAPAKAGNATGLPAEPTPPK